MNFKELLNIGREIEEIAQKKICKLNDVEIFHVQTDKNYKTTHYDFMTSDNITYEVKADFASKRTGNIFIETAGYGKTSGIYITTARYHIIYSPDKYYLIETDKLKELIKGCRIARVRTNNTYGYLLSLRTFIKHAIII